MTIEGAIEKLVRIRHTYDYGVLDTEDDEALDMAIAALEKVAILNGNTLTIKVSEEDFYKVKRIMLDNKPWCRMFYEEGGEAHWIKKYTPDDGEIYECDNCGVTWQFNDGGPEENEAFYCPKRGFKMVPKGEQHEKSYTIIRSCCLQFHGRDVCHAWRDVTGKVCRRRSGCCTCCGRNNCGNIFKHTGIQKA